MTDTLSAITSHIRRQDRMITGFCGVYHSGRDGRGDDLLRHSPGSGGCGRESPLLRGASSLFRVLGIIAMYVVSRIDYRRYEIAATPLYVLSLFALAGVFVVGRSALGAERWYSVAGIQIQPSEFSVLFLILAIATFCARRTEGLKMYDVMRLLLMAAVPLALIVKEPDLGTAIIIVLVSLR